LVTSDGLRSLSGLKSLARLSLEYSQVGDDGLRHLTGLTELEFIGLSWSEVEGDGLVDLAGLKKLNRLNLAKCPLSRGLDRLTVPSLQYLSLEGTQTDDAALAAIAANLPGLQSLSIDETRVTPRGIAALSRLKELVYLSAADAAIDDMALESLSACPKLSHLTLEGSAVTGTGLAEFRDHQFLWLNLKSCPISAKGMQTLANLPGLNRVNLEDVAVSGPSIELLARCPKLQTLELGHTRLSRTDMRRLRQKIPGSVLRVEIGRF
jgi:Leucine-rich repeat (LRR) protein